VLDPVTCLDLMRSHEVGRIAICVGLLPEIFPVNYVLVGDTLVFCTAEGTKLAAIYASRHVAFEVDAYDTDSGDVWSVVLKGRAEEIVTYDVLDRDALAVHPWGAGPKPRFIRLVPEEITGRRFHVLRERMPDQ
jgi:uncharacterized protein